MIRSNTHEFYNLFEPIKNAFIKNVLDRVYIR